MNTTTDSITIVTDAREANCTCPNCGVKHTEKDLDSHVRKCPRKINREFPKYLMRTRIADLRIDKRAFMTMSSAGIHFDSGAAQVEIGIYALEADFSLRPITDGENILISEIADQHSCSK